MNPSDKQAFAELLTGFAEIHDKQLTQVGLRIWWNALEAYSVEQVRAAFNAYNRDTERGQFMPKPTEIVRQIEGTPSDAARADWQKVDYAIRRIGTGKSWVFDDPKIHEALDAMGGSAAFSQITENELVFRRSEFEKRYKAAKGENYSPKIAGWLEGALTALIGDPEKAEAVLSGGRDRRHLVTFAAAVEEAALQIEHQEGAA